MADALEKEAKSGFDPEKHQVQLKPLTVLDKFQISTAPHIKQKLQRSELASQRQRQTEMQSYCKQSPLEVYNTSHRNQMKSKVVVKKMNND